MTSHGELTAKVAEYLRQELDARGLDVFHDHGESAEHVGRILSWFGEASAPSLETALSSLDVAVVDRKPGKAPAYALVEIEETNDRPKNLLGDVFGTLLGSKITFKKKDLEVGEWTTLIVIGNGPESHRPRNEFLAHEARAAQPTLAAGNNTIGEVVIQSFTRESELAPMLRQLVEHAVQRGQAIK